jgi:hypothetical protein
VQTWNADIGPGDRLQPWGASSLICPEAKRLSPNTTDMNSWIMVKSRSGYAFCKMELMTFGATNG